MRGMSLVQRAALVLILCVLAYAALPNGAAPKREEIVAFNTKSYKYHCLDCRSAKACTKNCIEITISEAKKRHGVACKVCGGTCRVNSSG
jgi:hypothetical protein